MQAPVGGVVGVDGWELLRLLRAGAGFVQSSLLPSLVLDPQVFLG